jgi:hypothetical protein
MQICPISTSYPLVRPRCPSIFDSVYVGGHDDTLHAFTDQAIATTIVVQNMTILLICCLSASIASGAFDITYTSGTRKETSVCKWVRLLYGIRIPYLRSDRRNPYVFPTRRDLQQQLNSVMRLSIYWSCLSPSSNGTRGTCYR